MDLLCWTHRCNFSNISRHLSPFSWFLMKTYVFKSQRIRVCLKSVIRLFGRNLFGRLAQIRSVGWRSFVRSFGAVLFGRLAFVCIYRKYFLPLWFRCVFCVKEIEF